MMEFKTKIESLYIDIMFKGFSEYIGREVEDMTKIATVKWTCQIDEREFGIYSICTCIDSIFIEIEYTYYEADDLDGLNPIEDAKIITDKGFEIVNEIEIKSQIMPNNIEVDFKSKKITVT